MITTRTKSRLEGVDTNRWQGTKRERVRLAGNAVTPPAARDLIQVGIESM